MRESELAGIVHEVYHSFKNKDGSQHIATFSSLFTLAELLDEFQPENFCDFGAGIGTLSSLAACLNVLEINAVERNSWCQSQMSTNVNPTYYKMFSNLESINLNSCVFIAIDDDINRSELWKIVSSKRMRIIFIEGWRNKTVAQLSRRLFFRKKRASFRRSSSKEEFLKYLECGACNLQVPGEKAGSYFLLGAGDANSYFGSWISRMKETREWNEFLKAIFFFFGRKIAPRQRVKNFAIFLERLHLRSRT